MPLLQEAAACAAPGRAAAATPVPVSAQDKMVSLLEHILAQLQLLTLAAASAGAGGFTGSPTLVTLSDPAVDPRAAEIAPSAQYWRSVRVFASGYQQNGIRISRSKTGGTSNVNTLEIIPDGTARSFILAPGDALFAAGIASGGQSTAVVGITPLNTVAL